MWLAARRSASSREHRRADLVRRDGRVDRLVQRRELRYGSWEFHAASDLARRLPYSPPVSVLIRSVVRDPVLIRVFVAVWRLPVIDLRVTRTDADAWSEASAVGRMISSGRRAQAVLELPTVEEHYLIGRPKQALRTNLRHARGLGVTSGRVSCEAWSEAVGAILQARHDGQVVSSPPNGLQSAYYVARDDAGTPLAFAGAALFGQFAVLFTMLSRLDGHPGACWARYQLHTFLALDLGSSGVRYLLVGSALREPVGNQHFQHLLGYRARNLRVQMI